MVDSVFDGTTRFVAMGAVGEMAIVETGTHLWEEMREFLGCEIDHTEFFDTRGVDKERLAV